MMNQLKHFLFFVLGIIYSLGWQLLLSGKAESILGLFPVGIGTVLFGIFIVLFFKNNWNKNI